MKPIRLVISLFFIGLFFVFWFSLKEGVSPKAVITIAVIFSIVFVIISFATKLNKKPKMRWRRKRQPVLSKMIFFVDCERRAQQKNGIISDNIDDYIIEESDRERDNDYDPKYKQKYRAVLFHLYDNLCPLCQKNQCEHLDHFFIPKCKGGNFIMVTNEGNFVNNAVPLCSKCNLKKGSNSYKKYFSPEQLKDISKRNAIMTAVLRKRF